MLYIENLEEIIFHRHEMFASDELIILSGCVGPKPIERLQSLPFQSKVIYGRNTIGISLINEGVYKFDFSV